MTQGVKTIFFHCGAPKTGTSYLQMLFAKHSAELRKANIIYEFNEFVEGASQGKITSGNGVPMANYIRPDLPHKILNKEEYINIFSHLITSSSEENFLISSEFLQFPGNDRTSRLTDLILSQGFKIKVIYFVRDIEKSAYSTYSQEVKRAGESRTFGEFVKTWDPHYRLSINNFEKAFGRDSVHIYNYEEKLGSLGNFFFKEVLGTKIEIDELDTVNRSLSPTELELLRFFNELTDGNTRSSNFVNNALMKLPSLSNLKMEIDEITFSLLDKKFSDQLKEINKLIRGDHIKINKPCKSSHSEKPIISDSDRFMLSIIASLVNKTN